MSPNMEAVIDILKMVIPLPDPDNDEVGYPVAQQLLYNWGELYDTDYAPYVSCQWERRNANANDSTKTPVFTYRRNDSFEAKFRLVNEKSIWVFITPKMISLQSTFSFWVDTDTRQITSISAYTEMLDKSTTGCHLDLHDMTAELRSSANSELDKLNFKISEYYQHPKHAEMVMLFGHDRHFDAMLATLAELNQELAKGL